VYNYYVEPGYKYRIYNGTKYRHDYTYRSGRVNNRGIDVKYISTRSGQEIKQRDLTRVRDSKDLKKDSFGNRDEIRTLDLKRDQLERNDLGRMEIKRENRRTTLEMDKVQIGRRENVTTEKRDDKSRDRNLEIRKNDQTRNDGKESVDKVFDRNRTETNRNSDVNSNRKNNNLETRKTETGKTNAPVKTNRKSSDSNTRKDNQVKDQSRVKTNESLDLNRNRQDQKKEVKRENTRVTNNDQVKRNGVKEQSRNNNQQNKSSETKVKTNRTMEKDKSRERSRR
jgi:hypothetical protein